MLRSFIIASSILRYPARTLGVIRRCCRLQFIIVSSLAELRPDTWATNLAVGGLVNQTRQPISLTGLLVFDHATRAHHQSVLFVQAQTRADAACSEMPRVALPFGTTDVLLWKVHYWPIIALIRYKRYDSLEHMSGELLGTTAPLSGKRSDLVGVCM